MCVYINIYIYIHARTHTHIHTYSIPPDYGLWGILCVCVCVYIYTIYTYSIPPDDGLPICPKHVQVDWRNKLRINSASSWFSLHGCIEMHGQQNIKFAATHLPGLRFGGLTCVRVTNDAIEKFSSSECRPSFRIIINHTKWIWIHFVR